MKIPVVNDLHWGFKTGSPQFREYFVKFFETVFFPYIDKHGFKEIIFAGDFFDNRKFVNIETVRAVREKFIEPLQKRGVTVHCILGNHDVYYKNTNVVNSLRELFSTYDHLKVYEAPTDVLVGDATIAMISWLTADNQEQFREFLKTTTAKVAVGHFELAGFEMTRGVPCEDGMSRRVLDQFDLVMSGHFHQKNGDGKVQYLGTQYDMTFSDLDETKGFHVFDTNTLSLEFVPNPLKMFYRLEYDDSNSGPFEMPDFSRYTDTYVKLVVKTKKNPRRYEKYISALYDAVPLEVSIVEEYELIDNNPEIDIDISADTLSIIYHDIDESKDIANPGKLKQIMSELYIESFEVE